MFLLGLLGFSWLLFASHQLSPQTFGQDSPSQLNDNSLAAKDNPAKFDVMIPVQDPQNPEARAVVYVDRPFLERLKQAQPEPPEPETHLISSADYQAVVDSQGGGWTSPRRFKSSC